MTTCVCGAQVPPDNQFCLDCGREVNRPKDLDFSSSSSLPWLDVSTAATEDVPAAVYPRTDGAVTSMTGTAATAAPTPVRVQPSVSRAVRVVTPPSARPAPPVDASPDVETMDGGTATENTQWPAVPRGQLASASNSSSNAPAWTSSSTVPPANPYAGSNADYGAASPGTIVNGRAAGSGPPGLIRQLGIGLVAIVALLGKFGGLLLAGGLFKWLFIIWAWGHGFGGLLLLFVLVSIVGGLIFRGRGG